MMENKHNKKPAVLLTCLILTLPSAALAGAESGFYLGAGAGNATVDTNGFKESDSALKLLGGFNFGVVPLIDVAVEASYVDFGKPENSSGTSIEATSLNAFGLAGLSFGPFGFFAKAGMASWDADSRNGGTTVSDSGTDPAYGIGARFAIGSISLRAEYEYFELGSDTEIGLASASATWTF